MVEPLTFTQILQNFAEFGGFSGLLPFVLTFLIFYSAAEHVSILDDRTRAMTSVIFALFVSWFLIQNPVYQSFFTGYLGRLAIGAVGLIGFLWLLGILGWNPGQETTILVMLVVIGVAGAFTLSGGIFAFLPTREVFMGVSLTDVYNFLFRSGILYLGIVGGFLYWAVVGVEQKEEPETIGDAVLSNVFGLHDED